jgi:ribosome-associated protein
MTKATTKKSAPGPKAKNTPTARGRTTNVPTDDGTPETTEGLDGAMRALTLALEKKALEPILLDVRQLCSFCNYQLVISGRSERQVDAIADSIELGLKQEGLRAISTEGARTGQWALLDYGDFVVHVFLHSAREHYDLEGLWNDAARIPIDVPADARIPVDDQYESALQ